jgi:hypothetical protein
VVARSVKSDALSCFLGKPLCTTIAIDMHTIASPAPKYEMPLLKKPDFKDLKPRLQDTHKIT